MDFSGPRDDWAGQAFYAGAGPQHQKKEEGGGKGLASKLEPVPTSSYELQPLASNLQPPFLEPGEEGLTDVLSPGSATPEEFVERELLLVKVRAGRDVRHQVLQLVQIFRARVLHIDNEALILEATGAEAKLDALEKVLEPLGILQRARTGLVSLKRRD